jgi:hypothetical protein
MTSVSRSGDRTDHGPVLASETDVDGHTINFVTFKTDLDHGPMLKGLPNDSCQCPHWGYVIQGRIVFRFDDGHEEVYEAGDAFYTPPGHVPVSDAGTEYVQFSPAAELRETSEAIQRNMQAMQAAQS